MTTYDNTNKGILAKNTTATNANAPEYKGSINVNGVEYWLSAWVNTGKDGTKLAGQKYFSLSVQPKDVQQAAPIQQAAPQNDTDDLPF